MFYPTNTFNKLKSIGSLKIEFRELTNGFCVFTTLRIPAHYPIYQAKDTLIFQNQTYQTVQVDEQTHLLDFVFANMNHSCNPSTFIDCGSLTIFAERDLEPGDELTFFYPSTEWRMERPFKCRCGASGCIGNVKGAAKVLSSSLNRYRLNRHIERLRNTIITREKTATYAKVLNS